MPHSQPAQRDSALSNALVCSALAVFFALGPVSSEAEVNLAQPIAFHIPAQALAPALLQFSNQARVQIATSGVEVGGLQSAGVSGVWPIGVALQRLLSGTGFGFRISGENNIAVTLQLQVATETNLSSHPNKDELAAPLLAQASTTRPTEDTQSSPAVPASVPTKAGNSVGALEEIVVTARKRVENAQDVPLSLTVLNAAALSKIGFKSITDLKDKVPALDITPDNNSPSEMNVYIRGIGQNDAEQLTRDNSVGVYLDDVYVGHGMMLASQLIDIERVEVLPGPQGTLYGRNTVGGAVKFISAKPTGTFDFKDSLDVGNIGYVNEFASVNLPETAGISVKLSALVSHQDGLVRNTGTGGDYGKKNSTGFRGALRWQPADNLTIDYVHDYSDSHGTPDYLQHQYQLCCGIFGFSILPAVSQRLDETWRPVNLPLNDRFTGSGDSVTAVWNISDHVSLKSISAYREFSAGFFNDTAEGFNLAFVQSVATTQHQFSQELLLTGSTADSSVNYHLGLFYFKESGLQYFYQANDFAALSGAVPYVPPTLADVNLDCICATRNSSKAIYGEVTWVLPILDHRLSLELGARSSGDTRGVSRHRPTSVAPLPVDDAGEVSYSSFDPALTIDYKLTSSAHVYAKVAKAYQAGGYDAFNNDYVHAFGPEHVTSYEVGVKSELLQHRLLLNVDVFDEEYKDIQVLFFDPNFGATGAVETVNAGRAKIKGEEAQIELLPVEALHLSAQIDYLDTMVTVTDPFLLVTTTGELSNSPKWKASLSVEYTFAPFRVGQLSALVGYSYNAKQLPIGNTVIDYRPSYSLLDARISLSDVTVGSGKLVASVWGRNLTNVAYQTFHNDNSVQFGLPLTYGVTVTYNFRGSQH